MNPSSPARIAVVSTDAAELLRLLSATRHTPAATVYSDLFADADALRRSRSAAVFIELDEFGSAETGALRVLRSVMPECALVLLCGQQAEVTIRPLAAELRATIAVRPLDQGRLTEILNTVLEGGPGRESQVLHDLLRGLADEINNPLQAAAGYMRLLEHSLGTATPDNQLDQLRQAAAAIDRMRDSMGKIDLLVRSSHPSPADTPVDLGPLVQGAAGRGGEGNQLPIRRSGDENIAVRGDPELLSAMVQLLCDVGRELLAANSSAEITLAGTPSSVQLSLSLDASNLPEWRLPRTYAPYYLGRVLRGTPRGLSLFLVQTIAQCHGGQATARRQDDGRVRLDVELAR